MQIRSVWAGAIASTVFVACAAGVGQASSREDISTLRANVIAWYVRGAPSVQTIRQYMRTLRADGSWPDVDYADTTRGGWRTYRHLTRTLTLAQAYRQPGHALAGDSQLRDAVTRALAHWVENDYINPNWWYPRIGVPRVLAPILVLMGEDVPAELAGKATRQVLGRSKMGMTGQNKVWVAGIAFLKGLLQEDTDLMERARTEILEELRITTAEGVQPDYSFHQHGPQQQWGNYGASFVADMIKWGTIFRGTERALDSEQIGILRRYLTEGTAWILWRGRMDLSGCGRQNFPGCQASKGRGILHQIELLGDLDSDHAETYRDIVASHRSGAANTLTGHKHYWRSDMTVHRTPTWYASVKMSSTRVIGAETCNSENLLGLHLGDGATYFLRSGREYEDILPVWDWHRLPGTTCLQNDRSLVPGSKRCRGKSDFVGGVSDGRHGVAVMEYLRGNLRARKAWFFIEEAVVCFGVGIDCNDPEPVVTSVNQCALNGPVTVSSGGRVRELAPGQHSSDRIDWVHHDGIGYVLLKPQKTFVSAATQRGDWHEMHRREASKVVERDIFNLWIDHGARPAGAQYAYAVVPDATAEETRSFHDSPPVTILEQSASLLAVAGSSGKQVQAVFFEPGRLTWGHGQALEVDAPCLVTFDRTATPARLCAADPTHRHKRINVRLAGRYHGTGVQYDAEKNQTGLTIDLPEGGSAGRTVTAELGR